jgi:hypothetical protein
METHREQGGYEKTASILKTNESLPSFFDCYYREKQAGQERI